MNRSIACVLLIITAVPVALAQPSNPPAGYRLSNASAGLNSGSLSKIAQLAFKPGDPFHLYASRGFNNVVTRYDYNPVLGKLSNPLNILNIATIADGMKVITGIGFHGNDMWITRWPGWVSPRPGAITRVRDVNGDGDFLDPTDEMTNFATGMELGLHTFSQVQIVGDTLYTGIGTQTNRGNPSVENVYNGTIVRIGDLNNPIAMNLTLQQDRDEFLVSGTSDGRMRYYAGGFRNPYGITVKPDGAVWVADNGADAETGFLETFDLFYRDVQLNDVAHFPPPEAPPGLLPTIDPVAVVGSHKGSAGFDFIASGPDRNKVLLAVSANSVNGRRLVMIDPDSGAVSDFLTGFTTVTDVVADPFGRLLIADWDQNAIYLLKPTFDGDANLDRVVDARDLLALANNWLQSGTWASGDFNRDGFVDQQDLTMLAINWQTNEQAALAEVLAALGLPVVVPEPSPAYALTLLPIVLALYVRPSRSSPCFT